MNKSINPNVLSSSLTVLKNKLITIRQNKAGSFVYALVVMAAVAASSLLFVKSFAVAAVSAPTANAGQDFSVIVGEAMRLDGSASVGYKSESQSDGTWSIRWETGDGFEAENIIKCPHVYTTPGIYTATLTVKDASGASASDTVRVTVSEPAAPAPANIQTLVDAGNAETNRTNLQAAVNAAAARSGTSEVRVPAGFVFNDPLVLPARTAANYVTIRVADLSLLPANRRVTGSPADRAKLFRMNMRGAPASGHYNGVQMNLGANYYRIIGLEIRHVANELNTDMIGNEYTSDWRTNNSHFIFDRCLLDGNGFATRKGAVLNGKTMSLINSSVLDIKAAGTETKAVAQWEGAGPLAVVNNRLEAASINSLIGGAPVSEASDILDGYMFRGNHVWKNPAWQGAGYAMKNLFELKQGFNTVAAGNIFENNYQDGQTGEAILIKSMTDEGCAYCEVRNVDFRDNKVLNTRAGFNVVNMQAFNLPHPLYANHIRFANNFWEQTHGRGNLSQGADYFEMTHNTFVARSPIGYFIAYGAGSTGVPDSYKAPGYKLLNNIAYDDESYGIALRCDHANGAGALNDHLSNDWDVRKNVFGAATSSHHPAGNFYPASVKPEFVDYAGGNFNLKTGSVYKNAGTDGKDLGADWTVLNAAATSAASGVWSSSATPPDPTPTPTPTATPTITPSPMPTPTPTATPTPTPVPMPTTTTRRRKWKHISYPNSRFLQAPSTLFDFDGDGKSDVSVYRPTDGIWHLLQSKLGYTGFQFGSSSDKLVPADYDGDGKTDIAVWRESPTSEAVFYIFESSTHIVRAESFGKPGDIPSAVGDWDGDGKADLAVFRNSAFGSQSYFFYLGSWDNPNKSITSLAWGTEGDVPQRGDFDGDGMADAAVFRSSNNTWYILQSSNNEIIYRQWGLATDKLVPSDYDGDGKTDLAVFRDGVWHLQQTTNGVQTIEFGVAADQPVAADYDGDGKSDLAVYRDGMWHVQRSKDGFVGIRFGLPGDQVIPSSVVP